MGRTLKESLQKALRGLETGLSGLDEIEIQGVSDDDGPKAAVLAALALPTPERLRMIAQAFREDLPWPNQVPAPSIRGSWRRSKTSSAWRQGSARMGPLIVRRPCTH